MVYAFGIDASGKSASFANLKAAGFPAAPQDPKPAVTAGDFWQDLSPGSLTPDRTIGVLREVLRRKGAEHDALKQLKKYFSLKRLAQPDAIGMTTPYAMGPLARGIARHAILGTWKDVWQSAFDGQNARVLLIETPLALALSAYVQGRHGGHAFISPGCECWEITFVQLERGRMNVTAFREAPPGKEAAAIDEMLLQVSVDERPRQWLAAPIGESFQHLPPIDRSHLSKRIGRETLECKSWSFEAAAGAAIFAGENAQPAPTSQQQVIPRMERLAPRSIGLLGSNAQGERFWRRIVAAGTPGDANTLRLMIPPDQEPTLLLASAHPTGRDSDWISLSQAPDQLDWWHDPIVPSRVPDMPADCLQLAVVHDVEGFRVNSASIGTKAQDSLGGSGQIDRVR